MTFNSQKQTKQYARKRAEEETKEKEEVSV